MLIIIIEFRLENRYIQKHLHEEELDDIIRKMNENSMQLLHITLIFNYI